MQYLEHDSLWESYVEMFKKSCQRQDWLRAKLTLDHALSDAEQFLEIDDRIVWCLFSLASWYLSYGNYERVHKLYKRLLDLKKKLLGEKNANGSDLEKLAFAQFRDMQKKQMRAVRPFTNLALSRWSA